MNIVENEISSRRPELSAEKQALLEMRLRGAGRAETQATTIPRRPRHANTPASFAQHRIWFLDQLDPGTPLYNLPAAVRLRGQLDRDALQKSLNAIVNRHEALRTCFAALDGMPTQVINEKVTVGLPLVDLGPLPQVEREAELQRLMTEEIRRPFDLSHDLMLRCRLFRLSGADHVLLVTLHHIASDAWSLAVFFHELDGYYQMFNSGRPTGFVELPVQYADFAIWQRDRLQNACLEAHLKYWRQQLADLPESVELPADHPMPAVSTRRGALESSLFPCELAETLKAVARQEGVTLFMLLLSAFKVLLHRYTRQTDMLVGSPISGRNHLDTEGVIGFFVNTLVLRTNLSGDPSFREVLQCVRQMTLDAYAHQDLPFEKLIEALKLERNSIYPPLLRAMFVLQSVPGQGFRLSNLGATPMAVHNGAAKFDLTLAMEDTARGLAAELEFNCDLFEPESIRRMLRYFRTLLEGVAANPAQRISELPLITAGEQRQLLYEWNNTRTAYPRDKTIVHLFENQVDQNPDQTAVFFDGQSLSYRQLNERANQLAHHLRKLGVQPDSLVVVSMERSLDLIVALVGILKAGGAYVSLDPAYPVERLALMLDDVQPPVVLTQCKLRTILADCLAQFMQRAGRLSPMVLCLDEVVSALAGENTANPLATARPGNLAYVSFTSGSTGRPKGVCVPHRGVVRLVRNTNFASFSSADTFLQLAPVAFDASTLEIWGALLNGARLVVYPPNVVAPAELAEFIQSHRITTLWLTAGLFNQMIEHHLPSLHHVQKLLAGGDILSVPHVKQAREGLPECQFINGYGPTENTTFTCCHHITLPLPDHRSIPIGRPVANTQVYVLDEHRRPVPVGVPGELFAGGDGLATGYLNRPELTAEKFIPHPFSTDPGVRLYRTGDLVRWLPGGVIEFLGRMDQQVKIRGFRVEPGEIETALKEHPAVRECAVTWRVDQGDKRLVAYIASVAQPPPTVSVLREFLEQKLPDYMVPSAFVHIDAIPLSPNGKVDRNALPAPDYVRPELEKRYLAPRNEMELKMAQIWEAVLGIHPVGVTDSFFELGGHSLLAVRLVAQIEKAFGRKIPVATVFHALTVERLVGVLGRKDLVTSDSSIVRIHPEGSRPPLFLVHGVGGGMFWGYTNLSRHLGADQPVYSFHSRGLRGYEEFATIEEMAAQYVEDLRVFQPCGPYYLGGYCFGGNVAYEMARQLHAQGERVALLALINCTPPNSSYNRIRWTPLFCLKFLKNLGYWIHYVFHLKTRQRRDLLVWKLGALTKRISRVMRLAPARPAGVEVEELVDLSGQPEDRRELWKVHVRALVAHQVKSYAGPVTLFRTRGHQFICSYDPNYGWAELAAGGVTVKVVPGSHESILEEPNVQVVARELELCLLESQKELTKVRGI